MDSGLSPAGCPGMTGCSDDGGNGFEFQTAKKQNLLVVIASAAKQSIAQQKRKK
jgi:hypothetical protein